MDKRIAAKILIITITIGCAFPAYPVQSPEFARTAEEWASLADNILLYEEIADLIHEYNPTVASNNYDYKEFVDEYGTTNEDIAYEYRSRANEIMDEMTGDDDATSVMSDAQSYLSAKQLYQAADNNTEDATTTKLGYKKEEAELVMAAQEAFIEYYANQVSLETANTTLSSLNETLALVTAQYNAGTATASDVRTAQKNVEDQETAVKQAEAAIEETRQSLIIMLGWKSTDNPEIGEVPEISTDLINAIDLESDQTEALRNNYTLLINERKLDNALDADNIATLRTTIESNKKSIRVSVNTAYLTLKNALLDYLEAQSTLAVETQNLETASRKYSAGLSTNYEYQSQAHTVEKAEQSVKSSKLELLSAYMTYENYVGGLASAE